MVDSSWNDEELSPAQYVHEYARQSQDRLAHLFSPTALTFKHAAEGTLIGKATVSAGFACLNHARASAAPLPSCPKTCSICVNQFRPLSWQETFPVLRYTSQHRDAEAADIVRNLVEKISSNLAHIRESVRTSGNVLAKRWQKRNAPKRAALLLAAMPNMTRRVGMLCLSDTKGVELSALKSKLSLPYLSVDTLSEDPLSLLALLHHRGSARISDWVMFDGMQMKTSFYQGALEASYNPHCVSMCGEDDEIGRLVFWNKDKAHRSEIIGYPLAKIILEAQSTLSTFLVEMVNSILQCPVELATHGRDVWDMLSVADFVNTTSDHTASSPRRSGYRAAPVGHLAALRRTLDGIEARHAASKSETWLLQTDPAYTRQTLASIDMDSFTDIVKEDSLTSLLLRSASRQTEWRFLEEIAKTVLHDYERKNESLDSDPQLRSRCATGLQYLVRSLGLEFQSILGRTRSRANQFRIARNASKQQIKHRPLSAKKPQLGRNMAFWALDRMVAHHQPNLPMPEHYLALVEHDVAALKKDEQFDETLSDHISDLSALDEAIMAIKCVRPDHEWIQRTGTKADRRELPHKDDMWYADYVDLTYARHRDILWPPLEKFLSTPIPGSKADRASLAAFDASHTALDAFWEAARTVRKKILKSDNCPRARIKVLMVAISANLSPDFATGRQEERRMLVNEIQRLEELVDKRLPRQRALPPCESTLPSFEDSHWNAHITTPMGSRNNSVALPGLSPQKAKIKTRPETASQDIVEPINNVVPSPLITHDRISVCPSSMDVFRRMFVSYGRHANANLRWVDFVKAMHDAGLIATWGAGGSAVAFEDSRGKGAIRLHQPHPDPSINPIMLRSFGKRMSKQFNWSIDTFVESV